MRIGISGMPRSKDRGSAGGSGRRTATTAARKLGAGVVRAPDDESGHWVLTDPEGNEFCAVAESS
jgi:hypothetical protein